jgi:hypothetical protein
MSGFFLKLSSDFSSLFAPKVEDWVGWCKGVANFHKEQADWYLDWVPYYENRVSWHKTWVCGVYQGSIKLCNEYVSLYEAHARWHKEQACFHRGRADVHQEEVRKRDSSCSYLDEGELLAHGKKARVHQNEADKFERMAKWLRESIGVLEDFVHYGTDQICWNKDKTCLCKDFSFWCQSVACGNIDLTGKNALNDRKNKLDDRKYKLDARGNELYVRWKELNARKKEELDVYSDESNPLLGKLNSYWNGIGIHMTEFSTRGRELHDRLISFKDHRLQLFQHPAVVQRQELILVLQGICKVLLKRKNENLLSFENKSATVASWKLIRTMELVLKWLKSSIFKELRSLGARLLMKI